MAALDIRTFAVAVLALATILILVLCSCRVSRAWVSTAVILGLTVGVAGTALAAGLV